MIGNFISRYGHTPQMCENLHGKFTELGHRVYTGGKYYNHFFRILHMVATLILKHKKYQFVIIETFSGKAFLWAYLNSRICQFLKKPYIAVLRGGNLPKFHIQHKERMRIYLSQASKTISPSPFLKIWSEKIIPECTIIENPIILKNYPYFLRKHYSYNLFWLRRFHSIYNPQLAISIVHSLYKQGENVKLTMAGPDSGELNSCKELAKRLNISHLISFVGILSKDQIPKIAKKHDIFINTSNIDNTPFTLIEGAALGLPIVSTNPGGIPILFKHNHEALLSNPQDIQEMTHNVNKLVHDNHLANRLSKNAREKVEQYDWEIIQKKWALLFSEINN